MSLPRKNCVLTSLTREYNTSCKTGKIKYCYFNCRVRWCGEKYDSYQVISLIKTDLRVPTVDPMVIAVQYFHFILHRRQETIFERGFIPVNVLNDCGVSCKL